VLRQGVTPVEKAKSDKLAQQICSAGKATAVAQLMRSDRAIAVSMESLDHNQWILNTPAGVVDLTTGKLHDPDPDALATKVTAVRPDFAGACPEWRRFLAEATGGDVELERYLQRLCGYALTGSTREQHLTFIYGDGGNGKSVFLNVLSGVLGDYASTATMDTFTASYGDKHTTDIAMLVGSRLVTASETVAGKRWDEARIKSVTGGEPITARFMRQDNFTFLPQFKLVFIGNYRPEVRDVGTAMRRRIQMVPFTITPARVDKELGSKLREEWPAILAWMIEGCLSWQSIGLAPPRIVCEATDEYFDTEDAIGRWLRERVVAEEGCTVTTQELFQSWREWAAQNNEYVGSTKRFSEALKSRGLQRWQDSKTRRMGYAGIRLEDRQDLSIYG
jgi:putative DNA primase/helicase